MQPIGYWLKRVDRLIDDSLERALAQHGLQRRHWQTLQLLSDQPRSVEALSEALRPFWTVDSIGLKQVLADLIGRGWITSEAAHALTASGIAANAQLADLVGEVRRTSVDGISAQEYQATLAVLARMAANLESAA